MVESSATCEELRASSLRSLTSDGEHCPPFRSGGVSNGTSCGAKQRSGYAVQPVAGGGGSIIPTYSFTVTVMITGSSGLLNSSRGRATILSITSMPRMTSPKIL